MVINQSHTGTMVFWEKMVNVRIYHVCLVQANNCKMLFISANKHNISTLIDDFPHFVKYAFLYLLLMPVSML